MIPVEELQRNKVWLRIKTLKKRYVEPVSVGGDDNKPDPTDPSNGYDSDLSPSLFRRILSTTRSLLLPKKTQKMEAESSCGVMMVTRAQWRNNCNPRISSQRMRQ